jgi:hypothetical protein
MKLKPSLAEQRKIQRQPLANFADAADVETTRRIGFLTGVIAVSDNFDQMGRAGIKSLFEI